MKNVLPQLYSLITIASRVSIIYSMSIWIKPSSEQRGFANRYASNFATMFVIIVLSSCSEQKTNHQFQSSHEALDEYRALLYSLNKEQNTSIESLAATLSEWKVLRDSVSTYLGVHTTNIAHYYPMREFNQVHDSIKQQVMSLIIATPRTYVDAYKLMTCSTPLNSANEFIFITPQAESFFISLDSISIHNDAPKHILNLYDSFLNRVGSDCILNKEQLLSFIQEEDVMFRSFLFHLNELEDISLVDITKKTEKVCSQISEASRSQKISENEVKVYMKMRSSRRLLLNSISCINYVKSFNLNTTQQAAYFWMILQPFILIDDLGISLLTSGQKTDFEQLANEMPFVMEILGNTLQMNENVIKDLPLLILKLYISTL